MVSSGEGVRPFRFGVADHAVNDLSKRLRRARLPEPETGSVPAGQMLDWRQGVPRSYMSELIRHWANDYDWHRFESEVNRHPQGVTEIFGLDLHFLHLRSPRPDARPLVLTHGWPSSVIEPMQVLDLLTNPSDAKTPAFHVVAPSLPGFGFSGKPTTNGWSVAKTADAWAVLMARLGYDHFVAAGGDWGGRVTTSLGVRHPDRVDALHTFTPYVEEPSTDGDLSTAERRALEETRSFWRVGGGYSLEQSTKPQTVGYALTDSPVAQLAWIIEKFQGWTDCDGHPENAISRDRMLDTVSLYWLTGTGGSSAKFYWENFPPERTSLVDVPAAISVFPKDIERLPRRWVEARFRNLQYWNELDRGGHFPMFEVPDAYAGELQRSFGQILR